MTVGKISVACWVVFVAMSLLFLPGLALAAAIGDATVPALGYVAGAGVIALWWGPFVYAMYLSLAVMRNGDKRLLARGRRGTAEVLEAERTNTVIQAGEFEWQAPFVYKYRLRITLPGKGTYETTCRICLTGIDAGDTVEVAVSPRNRHRVTIDPGSIRHRRATARRDHVDAPGGGNDGLLSHVREFRPRARELDGVEVGDAQAVRDPGRPRSRQRRGLLRGGTAPTGSGPSAETSAAEARLDQLERLGDLRDRGVLTPEEFAAEKARILGEPTWPRHPLRPPSVLASVAPGRADAGEAAVARRIVIVVALLVGTVAVGAASPAPSAADGNEAPGAPLAQRSLAVSEAVTCLRFPDGRTKCLGSNEFGAVGQGANGLGGQADAPENQTGADLLPIVFPGGHTPVSISSGFHDVCAVLDDGGVSCWGNNGAGQLGIGSTLHKGSPQAEIDLGTGRTATAVAVGIRTVCAVLDDGSVKCWGAGTSGVLGQGDGTNRGASLADLGDALLPVPLGTGRTATAVAVGSTFACAVLDDGSVRCWGENGSGQLGQGDTTDRGDQPGELGDALPPIPLGTGRTATAITAGDEFACALLDDGSVKCWGNNARGQLGVGDTANRGDQGAELGDALPSVPLGTGRTATAVTAGAAHACARLDDATVRCWGYNNVGQLGQGGTDNRGDAGGELGDALPAIALGTGRTAAAVSAGGSNSCALLDDGSVKCWGAGVGNAPGEMGDALGPRLFDGNGISGRVTSFENGINALVVVLDPNDFHLEVVDTTNTSGYFATSVPAGDHYLYVVPKSGFTYGFHGPPTLITVAGGHTTVADPTVAPTTGVIAGTVRDATTHDPVGGALTVLLDGQTGAPRRFVKADAAGAFQFAGLAPGNWFVGALDPAGAHQTAFYPGVASVPAASHVTVTAGGTAAADLDLPAQPVAPTTSAISGRVTESGTGTALSGIVVLALSNSDFSFERAATTSNTGNYNLYVPAGSHRVALVDPTLAHPMEWFEDQPYAGIAASTPVTSPAVVDATLTATTGTSALTGTVRDLGATKSGVWVLVIGNQGIAAVATTGSGGTYAVAGLAPGNYWLAAIDPSTDRLEYVPDATAIADAALHAAPADRTVVVDISLR